MKLQVNPYPGMRDKAPSDKGNCSIVTWTIAFKCDYFRARRYLKQFGYDESRGGIKLPNLEKALQGVKHYTVVEGPYSRKNTIRLDEFARKHKKGTYYVVVSGHALCVQDGVIIDHSYKPGRKVIRAWRIYTDVQKGYVPFKKEE